MLPLKAEEDITADAATVAGEGRHDAFSQFEMVQQSDAQLPLLTSLRRLSVRSAGARFHHVTS